MRIIVEGEAFLGSLSQVSGDYLITSAFRLDVSAGRRGATLCCLISLLSASRELL